MSWVRLDDAHQDHPKVAPLSDRAYRLWVRAIAYSNRYHLDGRLSAADLMRICAPIMARKRHRDGLVVAGLWHRDGECVAIHDIGEYQPTAEKSADISEKRAEAGRKGAEARWKKDGNLPLAKDAPVPSRPVPSPYLDQKVEQSQDNGGGIQTLEHLQARFCSRCGIGIPDKGLPMLRELLPLSSDECDSVDGSKVRSWKGLYNWVSALRNPQKWERSGQPQTGSEHEAAQKRERELRACERAAQRARKAPVEPDRPDLGDIEQTLGGLKISEIVGDVEPATTEEPET